MFFMFLTYIKFCINWLLFIIRSINLFLYIILDYKNLKFKYLINGIVIDFFYFFLSFGNFAKIKDIRRKYNPIMDLSKFTFTKKILSRVIVIVYNQICSQTPQKKKKKKFVTKLCPSHFRACAQWTKYS